MTYQQALGSVWDKMRRVAALARIIANRVGVDPVLATRGGQLAKYDLQSRMVNEFPELQGMGRHYAAAPRRVGRGGPGPRQPTSRASAAMTSRCQRWARCWRSPSAWIRWPVSLPRA